ncbi:MAG: acyl-CoA thioesterase [Oscillatoriaceae bacterium SKW80]|nr:acyl-CoA thioesterase [Oscillatoriaceae bacterium SKYG93]MCX8119903.1 acyl-CoA thioesterase [Oscillatoriaceae bacterium SKW80]MDW8451836.1 thioesterase family protein [Oscillatoriaceae cyanobacterium SKYGB_i_bin93]HIK27568.1 acyl-CoA thioesterase [Oscillatoriaceae cyanobacterium M7585_C2015_266]
MPFHYTRTVRFQDTDAAGVVYFANVLAICHEAYEASLSASGIQLRSFFTNPDVAVPIVSASVDFFCPLFCGDRLTIELSPAPLTDSKFEINYQIFVSEDIDKIAARCTTRHTCITPAKRIKQTLPPELVQWLQHFSAK